MSRFIPAVDYTNRGEPDYQGSGPYEPPPDYDPPRLRSVEITTFNNTRRPSLDQTGYSHDILHRSQPTRSRLDVSEKGLEPFEDNYYTVDSRKSFISTPSVGRRYQPRSQRRHPSMPPPRIRNDDYNTYNGTSTNDERFNTLRARDNDSSFGTILSRRSSRWCEHCPYCQKMESLEAERLRRTRFDSRSPWDYDDRESYRKESVILQEPKYGVVNKTKSLGNFENSNSARVSKFFKADHRDQLDVKQGELLQVLKKRPGWWKCKNVYGEKGWVPSQNLFLVPKQ